MNTVCRWRTAWLVLFCAFSGFACTEPSERAEAEEIRIGAWNIEQLGSPDRRSFPARNIAQRPADLAAQIRNAEVDVLALAEIGDTDGRSDTQTSATMDAVVTILNQRAGNDWTYLLFGKKDRTETFQLTGVLWNRERVQQAGAPLRIPVVDDPDDSFDTWQRHPHALKLSAGNGLTDFVVVPIHMKSNLGGSVTVQQRAAEAAALAQAISAVRAHFGDEDIVLLGDFNCLQGSEGGISNYVAAGFRDLNSSDQPTNWRGGNFDPAPFDRILVPGGQPEFALSEFSVLAPASDAGHVDHKKRLSDHFLVSAAVRVLPDDDGAGMVPPVEAPVVDVTRDRVFNAVTWMQNSAEYSLAARQAYRWAAAQLRAGLSDPLWSADLVQLHAGGYSGKPPAIILDVDETVLDNSPYNARLIVDGDTFSQQGFNGWALEKKAAAIPGAVEFIGFAQSRGVKVFYVTNRPDDVKQATIDNLNSIGVAADAGNVLTRNDSEGRGKDKASRRAAVADEHRIVLLIGDNMGDFCDGVEISDQAERNAVALAGERMVGTRWVVLPNAIYGGWEAPIRALADKRGALHTRRTPVVAAAELRIVRLIPNPEGRDDEAESVTVKNVGGTSVELRGWQLTDDDAPNEFWTLSGSLGPDQEVTVVRANVGFQLGNNGDTVRLLAPDGTVAHEVTYVGPVDSGMVITP